MSLATPPRRFEDERPGLDISSGAATGMRLITQVVGLVLLAVGAYFGIKIASDVLGIVRDPASVEPTIVAMTRALDLQAAAIQDAGRQIPIGRLISMVLLLVGYLVCAIIALRVAMAGGRLIFGTNAERREFYQALREFSAAARGQQ